MLYKRFSFVGQVHMPVHLLSQSITFMKNKITIIICSSHFFLKVNSSQPTKNCVIYVEKVEIKLGFAATYIQNMYNYAQDSIMRCQRTDLFSYCSSLITNNNLFI
jgi:hypothetical protein